MLAVEQPMKFEDHSQGRACYIRTARSVLLPVSLPRRAGGGHHVRHKRAFANFKFSFKRPAP
ncbi:hypothetical protein D4Q52_20395 [Rhodopseudomonas palustris]|uniref:Uncharacterized protein n=1 Tax=Rhodopseudomonas palustris TaxID=1076 RepID=A0A418V0Z5_RHOPL|nr:hypothetical protein D4Q52_20395 [Rhodopseudomonas palustris]